MLIWIILISSYSVVGGYAFSSRFTFRRLAAIINAKTVALDTMFCASKRLYSSTNNGDEKDDEYKWDPKLYPKLDPLEDYYQVLEISPSADENALKRAYYKLVIKYHPDNKSLKAEKDLANRQMMVINSAYRCLKDPLLRSKYDQIRQSKKAAHINTSYSTQEYSRSSTRTAGSSVDSSYQSSRSSSTTEDITISLQDFKAFLEDIYERSFPIDSDFVLGLYQRLQADPEFRENIIRNGDFRKTYRSSSSTRSTSTTASSATENEVYSRGDGSLTSLKRYLSSLERRKIRKEEALRADRRDWGEVKDMGLIRARLAAIDEVRDLGQEIEQVQDEIHELEYRQRDRSQSYDEEREYWRHKQEVDEQRYRGYRETHNPWSNGSGDHYEPQPQPQRQRSADEKKKTGFWGDDGDYGPRWRDSQERRRRGEGMSLNADWTVDDLLATRDHFQSIAEDYEEFAENCKHQVRLAEPADDTT